MQWYFCYYLNFTYIAEIYRNQSTKSIAILFMIEFLVLLQYNHTEIAYVHIIMFAVYILIVV